MELNWGRTMPEWSSLISSGAEMCHRVCKGSGRYPNRARWSQSGAEWGPHGAEWGPHGFARGTLRSEGGRPREDECDLNGAEGALNGPEWGLTDLELADHLDLWRALLYGFDRFPPHLRTLGWRWPNGTYLRGCWLGGVRSNGTCGAIPFSWITPVRV